MSCLWNTLIYKWLRENLELGNRTLNAIFDSRKTELFSIESTMKCTCRTVVSLVIVYQRFLISSSHNEYIWYKALNYILSLRFNHPVEPGYNTSTLWLPPPFRILKRKKLLHFATSFIAFLFQDLVYRIRSLLYISSKMCWLILLANIQQVCPNRRVADCYIVVSDVVLQSSHYVLFQINTLKECMNPLISRAMG